MTLEYDRLDHIWSCCEIPISAFCSMLVHLRKVTLSAFVNYLPTIQLKKIYFAEELLFTNSSLHFPVPSFNKTMPGVDGDALCCDLLLSLAIVKQWDRRIQPYLTSRAAWCHIAVLDFWSFSGLCRIQERIWRRPGRVGLCITLEATTLSLVRILYRHNMFIRPT